MLSPVHIKDSYFEGNYGAMFDLQSGNIGLTETPTALDV